MEIKKVHLLFEQFNNTSFTYYIDNVKLTFQFEHEHQIFESTRTMCETIKNDTDQNEDIYVSQYLIAQNLIEFLRDVVGKHAIFRNETKQFFIEKMITIVSDNTQFIRLIYVFVRNENVLEIPTVLFDIIFQMIGSRESYDKSYDETTREFMNEVRMIIELLELDFTYDQIMTINDDSDLRKRMGMDVIYDNECGYVADEIIRVIRK